jgi:hypothetical protein
MWGFNLAIDVLSQVAAGIGLRLKRVAYASNDLGLPRNAMPRRDSAAGRGAISGRVGIRTPISGDPVREFGRYTESKPPCEISARTLSQSPPNIAKLPEVIIAKASRAVGKLRRPLRRRCVIIQSYFVPR